MLEEFQLANFTPTRQRVPENLTWTPPLASYYKINVDGAVFTQLLALGVGVVITDSVGIIEVALSKNLSVPLGPLEMKAMALAEGFHFTWEVGICDAVFTSDSNRDGPTVRQGGLFQPPPQKKTGMDKSEKIID